MPRHPYCPNCKQSFCDQEYADSHNCDHEREWERIREGFSSWLTGMVDHPLIEMPGGVKAKVAYILTGEDERLKHYLFDILDVLVTARWEGDVERDVEAGGIES